MITASHNPKQDNGYKVYWENGCAIIPPHDHGISKAIINGGDSEDGSCEIVNIWRTAVESYETECMKVLKTNIDVRFCYTAMHGVGTEYAQAMARRIGIKQNSMILVTEQCQPDPDFSTVKFPNPEEAGALDLAIKVATENNVNLIIANDPDADRLGVAEFNGEWRILTGDEIGTLIASELLRTPGPRRAMLSSAVSSRMISRMCERNGIHWEETLTGFKWLGNRALELRGAGYDVIFAYEEALGYMCHDIVLDKDGVLAMCVVLGLAQRLYATNESLSSELSRLYAEYGFYASSNFYLPVVPAQVSTLMKKLRPCPDTFADRKVTRFRDLTNGYDSSGECTLPSSKSNEMVTLWMTFDDVSATMTVRGSGTEPKLKFYIEVSASSHILAQNEAERLAKDAKTFFNV